MRKILYISLREYMATAVTGAFLFGVVIFPVVIAGIIALAGGAGILTAQKKPLEGVVVVADVTPNHVVIDNVRNRFDPEKLEERRERKRSTVETQIDQLPIPLSEEQRKQAIDAALRMSDPGRFTKVNFELLESDASIDEQKQRVLTGDAIALVHVGPDALAPGGGFEIFHAKSLDADSVEDLTSGVQSAIVQSRLNADGIDPIRLEALQTRPPAAIRAMTETGETKNASKVQQFIPVIFMFLLWMSVMTGGQYLLMSTIEEKSSRVMEVLLSAVSPMQLMVGKIIGQGFVGLTVLVIYAGVGLIAAGRFGFLSLIPVDQIAWMVVYFLMAYFLFASLMAAAGSAVTEVREAQALIGPIMMLLIIPIMLWMPIMTNPNSVFARIVSFFPPATPFVMMLRMSQNTEPVPLWEVVATTAVGVLCVIFVVWAAAKIFRLGVLMYGKPPSLLGLVKMLRHA